MQDRNEIYTGIAKKIVGMIVFKMVVHSVTSSLSRTAIKHLPK